VNYSERIYLFCVDGKNGELKRVEVFEIEDLVCVEGRVNGIRRKEVEEVERI
jgi:hypothetical protein